MFNWFKKKKKPENKDDPSEQEDPKEQSEENPDSIESKSNKSEKSTKSEEADKSENTEESDKDEDSEKGKDSEKPEEDSEKHEENSEKPEEEEGGDEEKSGDKQTNEEDDTAPSEDSGEEKVAGEDVSNPIRMDGSGPEYLFDEVIDIAGYGRFQKELTLLAGMGWFADAFEVIILSLLGDYLACEWTIYRWENSLLTSTVFIGMMFGAPFFGVIADNYGRRTALGISLFFLFLFGAGSALSPDFVTLVVLRCIMGFALGGMAQGITLCSEYYPAKNRGIAGFYLSYFWAIGTILLLLVAWLIMETTENGWKWLLLAASIPALIVLISIKWYPESVRYYLVSNQYEEAVAQLNVMLRRNRTKLVPGTLKNTTGSHGEKKGNIIDLLRQPHTLTTTLFWYIWFATAFHYYGLVLITPVIIKQGKLMVSPEESAEAFHTNATSSSEFFVQKIPCDKYTNQNYIDLLWTSAAEFPGLLTYTILVQFVQRKTLLGVSCFVNTVVVLLLLVDFNTPIPTKILLFIARANICAMFQLVYIMTSETFPTTLRAVSMGSGSAWSRLGGAVVSFATQGQIINDPVAAICTLSGVILAASVAAALLPHEMKDVHMKDYSEEYEENGDVAEA